MPIERFRTYSDETPADRVSFHDYTVDVTPEMKADEQNWVPYIPGVHFIPLWFGTRSQPGFSNILRVQPGMQLNPHFHPSGVYGFTLLELAKKHYGEIGRDPSGLYALCR
jgi:2,4'-dihydroxyacetophenone dioxygenase